MRRRRSGRAAAWWSAALVLPLLPGVSQGEDAYDKLCGDIEDQASKAGRLYNAGRQAEAFAALEGSRKSFRKAKELAPNEPQAYVSLATALLNANQLDEALPLWKAARKRVKDEATAAWLEGRARWTKYGKVSMKRDRVYANGQGNLTAALALMARQLSIYPRSPQLLHDQATAHVMVSELQGSDATAAAAAGFRSAQQVAFEAWRAGVQERSGAHECGKGGSLVYDWPAWFQEGAAARGALVALDHSAEPASTAYGAGAFQDSAGYVARFEGVGLAGDDGVIVDEARCTIYLPSSSSLVNLVSNLQMLEVWGDPPMPRPRGAASAPPFQWHDPSRGRRPMHGSVETPAVAPLAASIVQFASVSFFHLLTEVLARLWLLRGQGVLDQPGLQLVAPRDPRKQGYLMLALRALAPSLLDDDRVVWWETGGPNDVRLRADSLYYADWRLPAPWTQDGGLCATPRAMLVPVRAGLLDLLRSAGSKHAGGEAAEGPQAMLFVLRKGQDMRSELEGQAGLRQRLQRIAKASRLVFEEFSGGAAPAVAAALFSRSHAVVGVHGGALSNIMFCPRDAVLFEIGFCSPFAGHYRHLAAAFGLRAQLLPLAADERGIGANKVRLSSLDAAEEAIRSELAVPPAAGAGKGAEL